MMCPWNPLAATATLLAVIVCCGQAPGRTWTDSTGKYTIKGEMVGVEDGKVRLRTNDDRTIVVPIKNLSREDQQFLANQVARSPGTSAPEEPDGRELRTVVVEGVGANEEEALNNAFARSVESAVGLLVDATTIVDNDEVITEKILTFSNAYIKQYKVVKPTRKLNGITYVNISATVKVDVLAKKLTGLAILGTRDVDGKSLAAEMSTKAKLVGDFKAMLAEATKGFPVSCLNATVGELQVGTPDARGEVEIVVPVTVSVNEEKYRAFDQAIRQLLGAAAKKKASHTWQLVCSERGNADFSLFASRDGVALFKLSSQRLPEPMRDQEDKEPLAVLLHERSEGSLHRVHWTAYYLDASLLAVFKKSSDAEINVAVSLVDARGNKVVELSRSGLFNRRLLWKHRMEREEVGDLLGVKRCVANISLVMPSGYTGLPGHQIKDASTVIAVVPFFTYRTEWNGGWATFSPELRFSVPMTIGADELRQVKRAECVLSLKPGTKAFATD